MARSQNGWLASPTLPRRDLIVNGVEFIGGILDNDDVETVLGYVLTQVDERVERLHNPGCWGFNYRPNRNASGLSNHASGTAVDANAPEHPNGVATARTFTRVEINEIHQILSEVSFVVRWGGDYRGTPDSMHLEINNTPERLAVVAQSIRDDQEDDVTPEQIDKIAERSVELLLAHKVETKSASGKPKLLSVEQLLRQAANAPGLIRQLGDG